MGLIACTLNFKVVSTVAPLNPFSILDYSIVRLFLGFLDLVMISSKNDVCIMQNDRRHIPLP
jgi:hypothetical protein